MTSIKQKPTSLNPVEMPLNGVALIEASAGTGKTFTITSLYLRLILGHQCENKSPEQILVVTFTRAATEELRSRIRARLKQAHGALVENDSSKDAFLYQLLPDLLQDIDREKCLERLKDAIQIMDLASIYTIHGFAQKLLKQYAVESHISDDFELVINQTQWLEQACRDVWRKKVYPLSDAELEVVLSRWDSPDALLKSIGGYINRDVRFKEIEEKENIQVTFDKYNQARSTLAKAWNDHEIEFIDGIRYNEQAHKTFLNSLDKRVVSIREFLLGMNVAKIDDTLNYFTPDGLKKSVKKSGTPFQHSLSNLIADFLEASQAWKEEKQRSGLVWEVAFIDAVRNRLSELKSQQKILSTDDLLSQLDHALINHPELAVQIQKQFPVALVDEFQDTDAVQYDVFSKLYVQLEGERAFFMIGDPKQAIYKFRGADIFTYIAAKHSVDYEYSLEANYRSASGVVNAVNTLFTQHTQPFVFDEDIPFVSVTAKSAARPLRYNDNDQAALVWHLLEDVAEEQTANKDTVTKLIAQGVAEEIATLLNSAQLDEAQLFNKDSMQYQSVRSQDIAVLVRNRTQAEKVKNALNERGVGCVYVGQESLYNSEESNALHNLLHAIYNLSERQYRNALAHPVWGLSLNDLAEQLSHEQTWEKELDLLYVCHDLWQKKGVMAMLNHWIHSRGLAKTWLSRTNGERVITNMLHLGELLQQQAAKLQGIQGLLTWLDREMSDLGQSQDQAQLRLESDANLVSIVTVHSSKGLEYPIVFLPYTWDMSPYTDTVFYHLQEQALYCDLQDQHVEQREREQLAEEVRLLYVGLTRASSQCYVSLPNLGLNNKLDERVLRSPIMHVLGDNFKTPSEDESFKQKLAGLTDDSLVLPVSKQCTQFSGSRDTQEMRFVSFDGRISSNWRLSSFSSLIKGLHAPHHQRFNLDEQLEDASSNSDASQNNVIQSDQESELGPFDFPKGAHAGNFLHNLLEEIDFSNQGESRHELIESLLTRYGIDTIWQPVVEPWLYHILNAPLVAHGTNQSDSTLSLSRLSPELKRVEMEFYFPVDTLGAGEFNRLLEQYPVLTNVKKDQMKPLNFDHLKGMMKGFIDLTFSWGEQYFILDYKSNHLGEGIDHYSEDHLQAAMAEHRYDVQLVIYTLALHRLLKLRIADYDYNKHIGGGYYLFLRGMNTESSKGQFFHKPAQQLIEALDQLISGEVAI